VEERRRPHHSIERSFLATPVQGQRGLGGTLSVASVPRLNNAALQIRSDKYFKGYIFSARKESDTTFLPEVQ